MNSNPTNSLNITIFHQNTTKVMVSFPRNHYNQSKINPNMMDACSNHKIYQNMLDGWRNKREKDETYQTLASPILPNVAFPKRDFREREREMTPISLCVYFLDNIQY